MNEHVLIIEDEEHIAKGIKINLEAEGYKTTIISNGYEAVDYLQSNQPDIVLLDVMLPGISGFEICERVREQGIHVPILFVTARDKEDDQIKGLELGGDDYITKPFSFKELLIRIKAILRRGKWFQESVNKDEIQFAGNSINFASYKAITRNGEKVTLTQKESMIMKLLYDKNGQVVDRNTILDLVWGEDYQPSNRTIDNIILNLRRYFEVNPKEPRHILTRYGEGYIFVQE